MAVTVQDADEGDTATSIETLIDAAEQIETVVPDCEIKEAALAANGSCVSAANDSNARAPISMKQDACGACISGVTTTFANGCWVHAGALNLGLLMRTLVGVGTPRGLQDRAAALIATLWSLLWHPAATASTIWA